MTPQQLQDLPFAGMAQRQLEQQGNWDHYAGSPMRQFAVDLKAEIIVEETIIVSARHEEEADSLAIDKFVVMHDCDSFDVETVEIRDSLEDKK